MTINSHDRDLSREEDFRDYEQRDIESGWPYADEAGAKPVGNGAYGESGGNFEQDRNSGFRTKEAGFNGEEPRLASPVLPETDHRELSDQIEADITERLELLEDIPLDAIDVHVDGHTATLEGVVDTASQRFQIEQIVYGVKGVEQVRNMIRTAGVDTHIPDAD